MEMVRANANWIDTYMKWTENSEPPVLYREWVAVAVIAACLQRKCFMEWECSIYPNFYIVLIGASGRCRKGVAMGQGLKLLSAVGINVMAESTTREALIRRMKESEQQTIDDDGNVYLHHSVSIFSKELAVFLGYDKKELMMNITDWYDCHDTWRYETKNSGKDEITGMWVNLIGAMTPELVASSIPRDAVGAGLTSRIIFVYAEDKAKIVPLPFQTPAEKVIEEELVNDLSQVKLLSGKFKFSKAFIDKYVDWYVQEEAKEPFANNEFMTKYFERRATHLRKVCMVMSAARTNSMIIDVVDFDRALKLLHRTEVDMARTFSGIGKNEYADVATKVLKYIISQPEGVLFSNVLQNFFYDVDKEELSRTIASLVAMDVCELVTEGTNITVRYTGTKGDLNVG